MPEFIINVSVNLSNSETKIRDAMSRLPYEKAMEMSAQITELGKALSDLNIRFHSPAVDVMGIEAGEYSIQRFIYHYFMKCFWNDNLEMQANTAINYDWYHPQDCTRHTLEEVLEWYQKAGLTVTHQFVDHYGITVRGKKGRA